jgi:hypothetical protein
MFAVIGKTCDACHDLSTLKFFGVTNLTTRPNGHHVGQDCSGCHSPNNWGGNAAKQTVKTQAARGTVTAIVTPAATANATAATATAAAATTPAASGATAAAAARLGAPLRGPGTAALSHFGVTNNCVSCHNGVLAPGKGAKHIASNDACENCHTTIAWLPARFDHRGIAATCASCHNSVSALGKPARHVQTTQDCSACHGTITFGVATFNHLGITATCQSCHNGVAATGKQAQHVRTALDCGSCHTTWNWSVSNAAPPLKPLLPRPNGPPNGPAK